MSLGRSDEGCSDVSGIWTQWANVRCMYRISWGTEREQIV